MNTLVQTFRQLARRCGASVLFVGLLSLGVGLSVAFFSVLDSALLRGLPFPDGDRLVAVSTRDAAGWPMPMEDLRMISEAGLTFEWVLPFRTFYTMVTRGDRTKGLVGTYVPPDLFRRLGVEPAQGRGFSDGDLDPAHPPVVLISDRLWRHDYGAAPDILGTEITVNREPSVVVGIMQPGFRFPLRHDVWGVYGRKGREWEREFVLGIGKLKGDVGLALARRDLSRVAALLDASQPEAEPRNAALETFVRANVGDRARGALHAMVFAALGLLALTCANLANLRMSESLRRGGELETRLALGARPLGLVLSILVENLMLGVAAMALSLVVAFGVIEALNVILLRGGDLERIYWIDARLDPGAIGFATVFSLAAALLSALAPMISTIVKARAGRFGAMTASRNRTAAWPRRLVSLQVGLCFALLVAAGVWHSRAQALLKTEPGFRVLGLSSISLSAYQAHVEESSELSDVFERVRRELSVTEGVLATGYASASPWGRVPRSPVSATALDVVPKGLPRAEMLAVSPDFFATLELETHAGRTFSAHDDTDRKDAIVSRALADRLFGGDALDRVLAVVGRRADEPPKRLRIIGIVANLDIDRTDDPDRNLTVFVPWDAASDPTVALIRRWPDQPLARPLVENALARSAPLVGALDELGVKQAMASSIWVERRLGQIFSLFATVALLLTAGGMYAVMAVMVRRRERELGIRAAIGAKPRDLQRLVLGESGRQGLVGLGVGTGVLWIGGRLFDQALVEGLTVSPTVLVVSAVVVGVCCVMGSVGPTRRASRVDPTRCLDAR